MYEIKLFDIPFCSSPIIQLLCAHTRLKYLSMPILKFDSALPIYLNMSSIIIFIEPYGFVVLEVIYNYNFFITL